MPKEKADRTLNSLGFITEDKGPISSLMCSIPTKPIRYIYLMVEWPS